jgi:hypothetical protein
MDAPKIAERVKFWQEQDRINQALIPRVLKMHELVTELSRSVTGISDAIAAVEGRTIEATNKKLSKFEADLGERIEREVGSLKKAVEAELLQVAVRQKELKALVDHLGPALKLFQLQFPRLRWLSVAGAALAIVALALNAFLLIWRG